MPPLVANQVAEQGRLAPLVDRVDFLFNLGGGGVLWRHVNLYRIVKQAPGEVANVVGKSRGKQQVLAFFRHQRNNALNVVNEAHVEHAIGFIEHQHFNIVKTNGILLVQVEQATGSGDQYFDTTTQLHHLWINFYTTENHRRAHVQMFTVVEHALVYLCREFTGGGHH